MLCIKLVSLLFVAAILCLMPEYQVTATVPFIYRCNYRCPSNENAIFTTNGINCFVLRNICYLRRANCNRLRNGLWRLTRSPKAACQAKCKTTCGTVKSPVCGEHRGNFTTYDNNCLLLKTGCENGQAILKVRNSACPVQD